MIPPLIHRCWFGSAMPEEFQEYGERWAGFHKNWRVLDWDEDSLPPLANQALFDHAPELSPSPWQFRADIARLELLYKYGGVYVDCDMEPLRPLDPLLKGLTLFAAREDDYWINQAILGAAPENWFIGKLISGLGDSVRANPGKGPNVVSGPQYLTRMYHALKPQMKVFPAKLFYPYSFRELHREGERFRDAYTKHHWANKRAQARGTRQPSGARI